MCSIHVSSIITLGEIMRKKNCSKNLKIVKKEIGHGNQFLITTIIGLNQVKKLGIEAKPAEFNVCWEPRSVEASANQSQSFIMKSAMVLVADNLDMYLRSLNTKPKLIQDNELLKEMDENGNSVFHNFKSICKKFNLNNYKCDMVEILICWRNRLVHFSANSDIDKVSKKRLKNNKEIIKNEYHHLDIDRMLESFIGKKSPTFKEMASLIRAVLDFIYLIDEMLISRLDINTYADELLHNYIKTTKNGFNNLFLKTTKRKETKIANILIESGFLKKEDELVKEYIEKVSRLEYSKAKEIYFKV